MDGTRGNEVTIARSRLPAPSVPVLHLIARNRLKDAAHVYRMETGVSAEDAEAAVRDDSAGRMARRSEGSKRASRERRPGAVGASNPMGTSNQPLIRSMVRRGWHVVRTQGIMVVGVLLVAVGLTLAITTHGWPVRATFLMGLGLALASEGLRQKAKAAGRLTDFRRSGAVVVFSLLMVDAVLPLSPLHRQIDQIVIRMMQLGIPVALIVWAIRLIRRWATRREPGVAQPVWHPPAATVRCFRCKQEIVTSMSRCPSCSALLTAPYALEYLPGKGRMAACQTGHNWRSVLCFHR